VIRKWGKDESKPSPAAKGREKLGLGRWHKCFVVEGMTRPGKNIRSMLSLAEKRKGLIGREGKISGLDGEKKTVDDSSDELGVRPRYEVACTEGEYQGKEGGGGGSTRNEGTSDWGDLWSGIHSHLQRRIGKREKH